MQANQDGTDGPRNINARTLREVTSAAAEILAAAPRRAAALTYVRHRGIDPAPLIDFPLGYAPPGWTRLVDELAGRFPDSALLEAGVARRSTRGTLIDAFRDRVIFPLRTIDGDVAGFVARDLSGDPNAPKYVNSRRSSIFVKGELLYGLREGLTASPSTRRVVVVEGPLDVLALASRARTEQLDALPVATCGTAFTPAHARTVARAARHEPVVVALDPDAAGREAAVRAGQQLRAVGADVRVAALPAGLDPADYLTKRGSSLDTFTPEAALPLLTVQVQNAIASQGDRMQWVEGRLAAARVIAKDLATYPVDHIAAQIGWISSALDLDAAVFTNEVAAAFRARREASIHTARPIDRALVAL